MNLFTKKIVLVSMLLLVVAGVMFQFRGGFESSQSIPAYLQDMGGDFVLQSANGSVSLQDFCGKVVLLFFGYTNCPDICPMTLTNWSSAFKKLSDREMKDVKGIFVSVDPGRETPETLKNYTEYFNSNIIGATGTHEELKKITAKYRSEYHLENEGKDENYLVDHMSFVYVIDKQGKVHDLLSHDSTPEEIIKSLRKFI